MGVKIREKPPGSGVNAQEKYKMPVQTSPYFIWLPGNAIGIGLQDIATGEVIDCSRYEINFDTVKNPEKLIHEFSNDYLKIITEYGVI